MISAHIETILLIVGAITASMLLQAIAPRLAQRIFFGRTVDDEYALFLARAAALPIGTLGLLLIWASFDEAIRIPIVVAAVFSKAVFVAFIAAHWRVTGKSFVLTMVVDGIAIALLAAYLLGF